MLNDVSPEELQVVLGLPHKIAEKMTYYAMGRELESLEEYKEVLSPKDMRLLEKKIRSLNDVQVKYLMNPLDFRMEVIRNLKETVIDFTACEDLGLKETGDESLEPCKDIKKSEPI
ncbi:MAG: hypothetical protein VST71_04795 [Nitrospirota bacterium]|nr:hypothetical protein [Nitrospirota bacterium]